MLKAIFRLSKGRWFYGAELIIDLLIVALSYYIGFKIQRPNLFVESTQELYISFILICTISLLVFLALKPYKCGKKMYMQTMFNLIISVILIAVFSIIIDFMIKGIGVWRRTLFYALIIQVSAYAVYKYFIIKIHNKIIKPRDCIIIGKDLDYSIKIAVKLAESQGNLFNLKYIFKQDSEGLYEHLDSSIQIFICSSCDSEYKTEYMEYCAVNNIDCTVIPSMRDLIINSGKANNINDMMMLDLIVKMDIESKLIKRVIDLLISTISIIILLPLMIIIYLLIYIQDRKDPIYSQIRLARDNREFKIYKFRSMIVGAEEHTGAVLATENDERITKLGKLLRASRIDELPQLFNVFKGEMSIVGPRPERPDLAKKIIKKLPEFRYRTLVKPGLTGYAQVLGRYDTQFKDKLLFDLYYVNNFSLLLDFNIMFNTIRILFTPSITKGVTEESIIDIRDIIRSKGYKMNDKKDRIEFEKM